MADLSTLATTVNGTEAETTESVYLFPPSYAQQRLWFLHQLDPHSSAYNLPADVHLQGPLDVGAMEQALSEIVRRHEALRTTFPSENGEPVQRVHQARRIELKVTDLR